ncbi:MAG TPA: DUF4344 domain-containing metallopeptidase [Pyrinomonadaceae bacterium]|nr:DUF4344 domain-containing metallopeptidase [Pyrinomonadaceae bacterium]
MKKLVYQMLLLLICSIPVWAQTTPKPINSLDKGNFKPGFSPITKSKNPKKVLPPEINQILEEITQPLNEIIALPFDVYLNFDECGEPNAFYSKQTREITMCIEFMDTFEESFRKISNKQSEIDDMTSGATVFFFFHELGHCLIYVWDLPATGREEDAVDQLAVLVLLDGTPEGDDMVLSGALFFDIFSQNETKGSLLFWDEHSFNKQRFYNTLCLAYGSNPEKNKNLLGGRGLPPERAERCQTEFKRADHAWQILLTPYIKS